MCGILGYIGPKKNAANIVLDGLKTLEYRGYDSWGVAVNGGKKIAVEKHVGKIGGASTTLAESSLGIGHTRWATHGGVTVENAHPHMDCDHRIALVHNGIVENYKELKEGLIKRKHTFASGTDTEVIVHLIEEELKKDDNLSHAVFSVFQKLHGLSAVVVMDQKTNALVVAKNGSPLVIGVGKGEYFVASDMSAILPHTKNMIFLEDHMLATLTESIEVLSLKTGKKEKPNIQEVNWQQETAHLGAFKHFMVKEIAEQPVVIEHLANECLPEIKKLSNVVKSAHGTFFIAAGTAYHACLSGIYLFSRIAKIHVNSAIASEFNYVEDFLKKKSLVMAFSQSGETIDVVEPLTRAQEKGATIAAVVNVIGSTIYRMADYKMLLGAGPEKAVASTKAYIAKLTTLLLLAYSLDDKTKEILPYVHMAADEIRGMLDEKKLQKIKRLAKGLASAQSIFIIGRGMSYPSALEAALKIKEVTYIHTEGLAGGELKHGTIALIQKGTPCIVFAPLDETYEAIISNAIEIRSRGARIIGISPKNSEAFDDFIEIKDLKDATILTQIVPVQLLSYYIALAKGINDPDKPRNLAKSVTVK